MRKVSSATIGIFAEPYIISAQVPSSDNQNSTLSENKSIADKTIPDKDEALFEKVVDDTEGKADTSKPLIVLTSESSTEKHNLIDMPMRVDDEQYLTALFAEEICESGVRNPSEEYFRVLLQKDKFNALNTISKIFYRCYSVDKKKISVLVGILHLLSHLEYDQIFPIGQYIALVAIEHKNKEIAEYGIKCYENWGNPDGIEKLQAISFSTSWLQSYANQVIADLSEV